MNTTRSPHPGHRLGRITGRLLGTIVFGPLLGGASHAMPPAPDPSVTDTRVSAAFSLLQKQEIEPARELLDEAIKHADDSELTAQAIAQTLLGLIQINDGQIEPGLRAFDQGVTLAARADDGLATWLIELLRGATLQLIDRSDEALASVGRAQTALERLASGHGAFSLTAIRLLAADSLPPIIWAQAKQMAVLARPMFVQAFRGMTLIARAEIEAARGDEAGALESLEKSRSIPDPFGIAGGQLAAGRAGVLRMLGHDAAAEQEEALGAAAGGASAGSITSLFTDVFAGLGQAAEPTVQQPAPARAPISRLRLFARLGRLLALRRSEEAMASFDHALALAEAVASPALLADTLEHAARGAWALGHSQRALAFQQRALDLATEHAWPCRQARGLLDLAAMLASTGDAEAARSRAEEGRATAERHGLATLIEEAHARLALLASAERYPDAAREELLIAVEGPGPSVEWPGDIELDLVSALLANGDGDGEKARKLLDRATRRAKELGAAGRQTAIDRAREIVANDGSAEIPTTDLDPFLNQLETPASRAFLSLCQAPGP